MQRKDTVTMSGEEFDKIQTNLWLITDCIDRGCGAKISFGAIRGWAQAALDIMGVEECL